MNPPICMDDIVAYHTAIKKLFDKDSTEFFPNNNAAHAAAIIEELFIHATKEVKVFCRNLNPKTWDDKGVLSAVLKAASCGVTIKILTQESIAENTEIYRLLSLLKISVTQNRGTQIHCNFIVADKKMFRFEDDFSKCHAVGCANCPELAEKLSNFFDEVA